jgi:serine/threonine-protein kinase ULK/ATG1
MQDGLIKGRYQITQSNAIGRGSFSRVYLGVDCQTHQPVAIKKIDLGSVGTVSAEKLTQELTIVQTLDHPNIVKTFDVMTHDLDVYIIMEYCSGGDFSKFLANKAEKEAKVRYYFHQLMEGLRYLRQRQILHRDLKPANLLLTNDNRTLKITDFGFARNMPDNTLTETLCGSPLYMAPEIFIDSTYSTKSDLWSLGVILYQSLYGKPPFNAKNQVELIQDLKKNEITYPKNVHVSPACLDLLHGLLRKDPHLRITWSEFFYHPWWTDSPPDSGSRLFRSHGPPGFREEIYPAIPGLNQPDETEPFPSGHNSTDSRPTEPLDRVLTWSDSLSKSDPTASVLNKSPLTSGSEGKPKITGISGQLVPRSNPIEIRGVNPRTVGFSYSPQLLIENYTPTNSPNLVHSDPQNPSSRLVVSPPHHDTEVSPDKESTLWMVWHAISSSVKFIGSLGSMGGNVR